MTTTMHVTDIQRIDRGDAATLATSAYEQLDALLVTLEPAEWTRRTDCPAWTVADMVGHMIGAAKSQDSFREFIRQQIHGVRHRSAFDGNAMDAWNDLQVRDHASLTPEQRLAELRRCGVRGVRGRMRFPRLLRGISVGLDMGGSTADGMPDKLQLGHFVDVILTRDVWLHRIDIGRATGRDPQVDSAADRRIVHDVVGEWAGRHGEPFDLELTGPAGGRFRAGAGGTRLTLDAVEFCRVLSGRAPGKGLLGVRVLF